MGYYTQPNNGENEEIDAIDSSAIDDTYGMEDDIEAAEEYLLEQESIKAKKRERALLKIRHAIEDYRESKRLRDELDYLNVDDKKVSKF